MAGWSYPVDVRGKTHYVRKMQRIAVLSDAIMASVLCEMWFRRRDEEDEQLEYDRTLSNAALGLAGKKLGIDQCVVHDVGLYTPSIKMIGTSFEAVMGAVYMDAGTDGLDTVRKIMTALGLTDLALLSE
ncbi:hypothetical protein EK21DRAFT_60141 [Setomelanomma holmii]|uniref:RNase III domain-containing protein n=1 Tax=Setomelanomma holmii TaxID=210430 RepID=A0A9P4LP90_9PLEO|nr:hypothetical protein EK21DRAFT_60141 [Setomelanomma holmii]